MLGSQQSPVIDYFHILITLWTNDYLNEHLTRFIISMDEKVTGLNSFLMVSVIYSLCYSYIVPLFVSLVTLISCHDSSLTTYLLSC